MRVEIEVESLSVRTVVTSDEITRSRWLNDLQDVLAAAKLLILL